MKVVTGIFTTIGILAVLLLIFMLIGYLLFSLTPDLKSEIVTAQPSADAAKSFNNKVTTFRAAVTDAVIQKQKVDINLMLTEQEINSKLIDMESEGTLPVRDMVLQLENNMIMTYFQLNYEGVTARIGLIAQPQMIKDDIKMNVVKFELGKLPLPKSFNARAADALNILIKTQNPLDDLPISLKAIEVSRKQIIIRTTTVPGS